MIKKLPSRLHNLIIETYNLMLVSGHISEQWKSSMIIPISKPEKFNYNMVNVRPIALLDTFRKVHLETFNQNYKFQVGDDI
jgi:hypothetical protein